MGVPFSRRSSCLCGGSCAHHSTVAGMGADRICRDVSRWPGTCRIFVLLQLRRYCVFFCGAAAGARLVEMPKFGRLHPVSSELLATFFWLAPPCLIMLFNVISQMGYRIVSGSIWPILTTTVCLETFSTLTSLPDAPTALLDMERTRNRRIVRRLASAIVGLFALLSVFASRSGRNDFEGILVLLSVSSGYVGFAAGAWLGGRNMGIQIG